MHTKFLGMTVPQSLLAGLISVVLLFAAMTATLFKLEGLASQGAEAHTAVCSYKMDLEQRLAADRKFLLLTPKERREKYGAALGSIPKQTIEQGLHSLESAVNSLHDLRC